MRRQRHPRLDNGDRLLRYADPAGEFLREALRLVLTGHVANPHGLNRGVVSHEFEQLLFGRIAPPSLGQERQLAVLHRQDGSDSQ